MDSVSQTLISLVKAGIYGGVPQVGPDVDWDSVLSLADKHTVICIAADAALRLPPELRPKGRMIGKAKSKCLAYIKLSGILNSVIVESCRVGEKAGIKTVLLKGQGVAALYPDPQYRQSGDVDLWAGPGTMALIEAMQKEWGVDRRKMKIEVKHVNIEHRGIEIEVHKLPVRLDIPWHDKRFQQWALEELSRPDLPTVELAGEAVRVPRPTFNAFFLFCHAWQHFIYVGVGLRHLCDLALLLTKQGAQIDRPLLEDKLRQCGLVRSFKIFAYMLVQYLGVPEADMPLFDPSYRRAGQKAMQAVLSGGNFGHYDEHWRAFVKQKSKLGARWQSLVRVAARLPLSVYLAPADTLFNVPLRAYWGLRDLLGR